MERLKKKVFLFIDQEWMCYLIGLGIIALSMFLVMNEELVGGILGPWESLCLSGW